MCYSIKTTSLEDGKFKNANIDLYTYILVGMYIYRNAPT